MTTDTNTPQGQQPPVDPCKPPQDTTDPCAPPADPNNPPSSPPKCAPLDPGPEIKEPPTPEKCPERCCCPGKPGTTETCLDDLIDQQSTQIAEADRAKSFKADLEDLLKKAKSAQQEYTQEKYKDLRTKWDKQDADIADFITKQLACAVSCWWCLIECEICPLIYAIRNTDLLLNGNGTLAVNVNSLRDQQYWQVRKRDAKKEVFDRVKLVLAAWEKPAQTIEKALSDNAKLLEDTKKIVATDPAAAVYDVFMKLVPMHLAIAPRDATSNIGPKYTKFCECDLGKPDADCCGPDVGVLTLRQRLIGPQPYLIAPEKFWDLICCLAKNRYLPAKEMLAKAESDLTKTDSAIKRAMSEIEQKKISIAADYRAHVVTPIDCDKKYKGKGGEGLQNSSPAATGSSQQSSADTAR